MLDEKMYGNYTLRVMLPNMPADEAEFYKSKLAPLPKWFNKRVGVIHGYALIIFNLISEKWIGLFQPHLFRLLGLLKSRISKVLLGRQFELHPILTKLMRLFIILVLLLVPVTCFSEQENRWKELAKGFHVATYPMPIKSFAGDSKLTVVRITRHTMNCVFWQFQSISMEVLLLKNGVINTNC